MNAVHGKRAAWFSRRVVDPVNSVAWYAMDGLWLAQLAWPAYVATALTLATGGMLLLLSRRRGRRLNDDLALNAWMWMNALWLISDLGGRPVLRYVALAIGAWGRSSSRTPSGPRRATGGAPSFPEDARDRPLSRTRVPVPPPGTGRREAAPAADGFHRHATDRRRWLEREGNAVVRPPRFHLRTMMISVAVVGVFMAVARVEIALASLLAIVTLPSFLLTTAAIRAARSEGNPMSTSDVLGLFLVIAMLAVGALFFLSCICISLIAPIYQTIRKRVGG